MLAVALSTTLATQLSLVGGKAASLIRLTQAGFAVPDGYVLTSAFFVPWINELRSSSEWRLVRERLGSTDSIGLHEACEAAKRLADDLPFTGKQRAQLEDVQAGMGDLPMAVRSSSPEEDLSGTSFAGLYETVLNVTRDQLEQAVRSCFASSLDERVLLYKQEHDLSVEAPTIAVIVQAQIASDKSGVGFSLNPLTNDFDETLINASWGQGQALVSGDINPDRFVINKISGEIVERLTGSKGGDRPDEFCLHDEQLSKLNETLKAIEDLFAMPVDVEWAFAEGHLHVLQARPITAFIPLAPEMLTVPGEPRLLYVDGALSKGPTINGAITPITSDYLRRLIRMASEAILGWEDVSLDPKRGLLALAGARLYMNLSSILHLVNQKRLIENARFTDAMMAEVFETHDLEIYRPQRPLPSLRILPLLFTVLKGLWRTRGLLFGIVAALFRRNTLPARYRTEVESFEQAVAEQPDFALPIDAFLRHYYSKMSVVARNATAPALIAFIYFGVQRLDRLIDQNSETQRALADSIKRGYSGDLVVEMGAMMFRLSILLPPEAFADIDTLVHKLKRRDLPEAFLSAWDEFIHKFGCRGPMEMEIANPKYGDDLALAIRQIATIAKSGGTFDPRKIHQKHVEEREAAYATLHAQLKGRKRRRLERCYRNIVEFGGTRDTPKHHIMMISKRVRERLLAQADKLIEAGRLDRREQIFELTFDDLEEAARDPTLDLRARRRESSRVYHKVKASVRHFPPLIDSRGRILRPIKPSVAGELSGFAVSPGVATGRVKILDNPTEKDVMPGDVLVAYTTDPGWTPLFINTAAVVLEVGGELQHGALIAREYGKPCVAGIDQVTTKLHDGEIIEVDGNSGVVRLIRGLSG